MSRDVKAWYASAIVAFVRDDIPRLLGLPPAAFARDVIRLEQRLAFEGESFLTKALPALGRCFDQALQGHVPLAHPGFKRFGRTSRPAFMQALTERVFEDDGWLRNDPCTLSIRLMRQLLFWCKKVEKGYSDESLQRAADDLIEVDGALPSPDTCLVGASLDVARDVLERVFNGIAPLYESCAPRHGPGAVADGRNVAEKRSLGICYTQLEEKFKAIPWFFSLRDASEDYERITGRTRFLYGLSRIAFVNKDSGGPRVIGLEPAEYMWTQQALKAWMYEHIEYFSPAKGHINFTDQSVNRDFALRWWEKETLDMSDASNRNSLALVCTLLRNTCVLPWLLASRTPGAVLPDGRTLFYKKFAPMGSAVCFPVQACVYYALACAALVSQGMPLKRAMSSVYVYGDDLIVPRFYFKALNEVFTSVGLKFNANKCCIHGKFRESCGMDAYDGVEVTPVRMKRVHYMGGQSIWPSIVAHANELHKAGYWEAAASFRSAAYKRYPLMRKLKIPWATRDDYPILVWLNNELDTVKVSYKHQISQVSGWRLEPIKVLAPAAYERQYLRESLSRGGPVGELSRRDGCRYLDRKYAGKLRYRTLPYLPRIPGSTEGLTNLYRVSQPKWLGTFPRLSCRLR